MVVNIGTAAVDGVGLPDIALGQFQKMTARRQHGQVLFHKTCAGQRVEDDVDPLTTGIRQNLLGKRQRARIVEMGDPQRP